MPADRTIAKLGPAGAHPRLDAWRERWSISPRAYTRIALAALVLLNLIVFSGAAVRLTGSGLGCSDWPQCTTSSFHPPLNTYSLIEFSNRVFVVLVTVAAIAAWLGTYLRRPLSPRRRDLRLLGVALPVGVLAQAVVGGESVLYKLAPVWVMAHYWLSMIILIAAFELWHRSRLEPGEAAAEQGAPERWIVLYIRALVVVAALVLVLGSMATAAGPHAGASGTGQLVHRLGWWGVETLRRLVVAHGLLVTSLGLATVGAWWVARRHDAGADLVRTLTFVCLLLAAQGVVGITQYALELPTEIVWVHVVLATLTWVGYVHAWVAAGPLPRSRSRSPGRQGSRSRPAPRPSATP